MLLLLWILSFAQVHAQESSPWTVLREEVIEAPVEANVRQIPLHLVVEARSAWDSRAVQVSTLNKTAAILRQCGFSIGRVDVTTVTWDAGLINIINNASPYKPSEFLRLVQGGISTENPVFFLFGTTLNQSASAYNLDSVTGLSRQHPETMKLLNVSVITGQYTTNAYAPNSSPAYNTFAHELVHILSNVGHIEIRGNLMAHNFEGRGAIGDRLAPSQCEAMKDFPHL